MDRFIVGVLNKMAVMSACSIISTKEIATEESVQNAAKKNKNDTIKH